MGTGGSENAAFSFSAASSPRLCSPIASRRIFSDVAEDVTVSVDGQSFLLHKFPLVSRCGRVRKMLIDAKEQDLSKLELANVPGGAFAFELAAKFCYGSNFEITTGNVAHLRCVAEFLEMTEDYREENLIARTETYLNDIVFKNLDKSLEVLRGCDELDPMVEEVRLVDRCVDAIALNACKEQLVSGLAQLECDGGPGKLRMHCQDWWVEDLSSLRIDYYQRVIAAMRRTGVRPESIGTSIMHYAQTSLKGIERLHVWDSGPLVGASQRVIVETLIDLLATENITTVTLSFLFGMLRMAIEVDTGLKYRIEIEKRIGLQLGMASLDDLLIPSAQTSDLMFDVDTVHRILVNFLQRIDEDDSGELSPCGYDSDGLKSPSHSSVLKVGRLMDGYLAEIAPDPYLKLQKFMALIELLPDYARIVDDGLYRSIDIYLKAHPSLTDSDCKKLCKLIDCQKLSEDASSHAAQNHRLPVQMAVRVLYFEQLRLKSSFSGDGWCVDGSSFSHRLACGGVVRVPARQLRVAAAREPGAEAGGLAHAGAAHGAGARAGADEATRGARRPPRGARVPRVRVQGLWTDHDVPARGRGEAGGEEEEELAVLGREEDEPASPGTPLMSIESERYLESPTKRDLISSCCSHCSNQRAGKSRELHRKAGKKVPAEPSARPSPSPIPRINLRGPPYHSRSSHCAARSATPPTLRRGALPVAHRGFSRVPGVIPRRGELVAMAEYVGPNWTAASGLYACASESRVLVFCNPIR